MLSLVVVAIMLGFPTAFTLMGMGVFFGWLAYRSVNPDLAVRQILDLMVQRAYSVMSNDVLIAVPLFVFMGYLVERANLIEKLFKSLHLALARVPGSLAVATIVTCAIFATATGIVGAVVTLMGLLALPAMLRAGYSVQVSAGAITAGGCLGILIPPSVLLIVYGATAGVSVVQLYAGAFFPGIMLAGLYVGYVIVLAKMEAPPHAAAARGRAPRAAAARCRRRWRPRRGRNAFKGLLGGGPGRRAGRIRSRRVYGQFVVSHCPAISIVALLVVIWHGRDGARGGRQHGGPGGGGRRRRGGRGRRQRLARRARRAAGRIGNRPRGAAVRRAEGGRGTRRRAPAAEQPKAAVAKKAEKPRPEPAAEQDRRPDAHSGSGSRSGSAWPSLALTYGLMTWERFEIFKMLLTSFFPLAVMILAVLGSIVFGLATPTEAAAVGAFGGFLLAAAYRYISALQGREGQRLMTTVKDVGGIVKESSFLTAKTTAMVCWLFVGSSIFSASFALLGGQEIIERWVLSLGLTTVQFMLLAQFIIFILGWPLEWTEIIVIFMPIFIPLLVKFNVDPLFFGLLVALNLQTAFLSPPVAMAAFYLKGVAPSHVTLNQIFAGMLPFMGIQVVALALLYVFPEIGLWLPHTLYK